MSNIEKYKELGFKYIFNVQPKEFCMVVDEPKTEEERTVQFYEQTTPYEFLEIRSRGSVMLADLKMAESLMKDYHLNSGVVNCLIDFVLYTNDMKLPKALVNKIAGHWARKGVNTVSQAMELAIQELRNNKPTNKQENIIRRLIARNEHLEKRVDALEKKVEKLISIRS